MGSSALARRGDAHKRVQGQNRAARAEGPACRGRGRRRAGRPRGQGALGGGRLEGSGRGAVVVVDVWLRGRLPGRPRRAGRSRGPTRRMTSGMVPGCVIGATVSAGVESPAQGPRRPWVRRMAQGDCGHRRKLECVSASGSRAASEGVVDDGCGSRGASPREQNVGRAAREGEASAEVSAWVRKDGQRATTSGGAASSGWRRVRPWRDSSPT